MNGDTWDEHREIKMGNARPEAVKPPENSSLKFRGVLDYLEEYGPMSRFIEKNRKQ